MGNKKNGLDLSHIHMNTVGREDAAAEVIKPKLDSATKTRNAVLISVVVVALVGLMVVQFFRSGKIWESPEEKRQFAPGEHNIDKSE